MRGKFRFFYLGLYLLKLLSDFDETWYVIFSSNLVLYFGGLNSVGKFPRQGGKGKNFKSWISMKFDMRDPRVPLLCFFEVRTPWGNSPPHEGKINKNPSLAHISGTNCQISIKFGM